MTVQKTNEKTLIQKLDLDVYIQQFHTFLAREKSLDMKGDINQHYAYIQALSKVQFPTPPLVPNLDNPLRRIQKQAILSLDEIYAFVSMLSYFNTLKTIGFTQPLTAWIQGIDIPIEMIEVIGYFTQEGEINPQKDAQLHQIEQALKSNTKEIKETLYKLTHHAKLRDYLVDTQIHFNGGEETLLVRGGYNHAIKATVVSRSAGGFFYILPQSIAHLKEKKSLLLSNKEEIIYQYCKRISALFFQWERFLHFVNKEYDRFDHYQARVSFARAKEYQFIRPSQTKQIKLQDFAHPAIENPVLINMNFDKHIMLVTGVNAGGKTMLLKSMLSAVYLCKYLLPFQCHPTQTIVGHYKHIEAVIDDPQSVKNDISTFAGRMQEFAKLFQKEDAIVGVDEIELGTDSDEAASLFRVMLDALRQRGIHFIVTTHHKRLASLMATDKDVELIAALYDEARRLPTYTFLQGSIGKSYAFETAQRYGVPSRIVDKAKEVYGEDKENLNELIEKSTSLEREMRLKIAQIDTQLLAVEQGKRDLEESEKSLQEQHRKAIATLENRYNAATKKAQEALKVKESTEGRRLLTIAHKRKDFPSKALKHANETIERPLKAGDKVKYRSHKGELLSFRKKEATILIDGLKMRVPLSQVKYRGDIPKSKSNLE
ncbi:MAG: endonuclease MutS2 [Sulfurovum sp.]|nr:endonuclease MutS2 [Sulfurovum sp.]